MPITFINRYTYAHNNPFSYTDPTGRAIWDVHGNYCGPTARGEMYNSDGQYIGQAIPEDSFDSAFQRHDEAYRTLGKAFSFAPNDTFKCAKGDFDLTIEALRYSVENITKPKEVFFGLVAAQFGYTLFITYSAPMLILRTILRIPDLF